MTKNNLFLVLLFFVAAISGCTGEKTIPPESHKGSAAQWHSFRGNAPGNAGVADEAVAPPLGLLWYVKIEGPTANFPGQASSTEKLPVELRSSPAVDERNVYIGASDGNVYAFDRATGKTIWKFPTGGNVIASPVLEGNILYVGSASKKLYAIDTRTGKETQRAFSAQGVINGSAAITKDLVIFGSYDNYIYALDKNDISNRIVWSKKTGDWVDSTPTVDGASVYVGSNDGSLYKLALADGNIIWQFQTGGPVYSTPLVSGGKIFFTSWDGSVYALDPNGKLLWKTKVDEQVSASVAIKDGKLYGGGMFNGPLFELDAANGKILNSFKTWGGFDASPVISGRTLYIGSFDDNFYAVNIDTFKVEWKRAMRGHVRSTCAVANDTVFVADTEGRLFALAPVK